MWFRSKATCVMLLFWLLSCWESVTGIRQTAGLGNGSALPVEIDGMREIAELRVMSAAVKEFREALAVVAADAASTPPTQALKRHARGIVISAGGELQFVNAYATMRVVREVHGSSLPIVLAYYGQNEYVHWIANEMKAMSGIHFKDVSLQGLPPHLLRKDANMEDLTKVGYFKKIIALYQSPFHEVLYLDCDSMPVSLPDVFFESPGYVAKGSMFFPDIWREGRNELQSPKARCYELLGLDAPWLKGPWGTVESGQIILNLKQHSDILDWVVFLNSYHDILYQYTYGDKDLFEMAFMLAGKHEAHFFRNPLLPRLALMDDRLLDIAIPQGEYRMLGQCQVSETGMPWFLHRAAVNKLDLRRLVFQSPRPVVLTSVVSYALTHNHMLWKDVTEGHTLPAEVLDSNLDCTTVDKWMLRAWYTYPAWIPLRSRGALEACLLSRSFDELDTIEGPNLLRAALIPIESFGEEFYMATTLQIAALVHLKLVQRDSQARGFSWNSDHV